MFLSPVIDRGEFVLGMLFIDNTKAFDAVDHDLL